MNLSSEWLKGARLTWSSANAAVAEDLVLTFDPHPKLSWYGGYFYDFPLIVHGTVGAQETALGDFLRDFFAERVVCTVHWENGRVVGGGPVWVDEEAADPSYTVRSWRGSYDRPPLG